MIFCYIFRFPHQKFPNLSLIIETKIENGLPWPLTWPWEPWLGKRSSTCIPCLTQIMPLTFILVCIRTFCSFKLWIHSCCIWIISIIISNITSNTIFWPVVGVIHSIKVWTAPDGTRFTQTPRWDDRGGRTRICKTRVHYVHGGIIVRRSRVWKTREFMFMRILWL